MSSESGDDAATPPSSFLGGQTSSVLLLGAVLLCTLYAVRHFRANRLYPPGPRGFPFLGYLYVLWTPDKRKLFAELRAEHGDVFSFNLGCRLVVVINGFETLRQAFVHQGGSFVDRPQVFTFTHVGQGKGKAEVLLLDLSFVWFEADVRSALSTLLGQMYFLTDGPFTSQLRGTAGVRHRLLSEWSLKGRNRRSYGKDSSFPDIPFRSSPTWDTVKG